MLTGWCRSRAWNTPRRCDIVDNWDGPVVARSHARREDDAARTAHALKWWNGAQPIAGTLAARYLAEVRGIDLDVLPDDISERACASTRIACLAPAPGTPACSR